MKENAIRGFIVIVICLVLYHLLAFLIPFEHTTVFWLAYGFTLAAFVVAGVAVYLASYRGASAKSQFYGFPIARIGVIYGALQLGLGLVFMALGAWIAEWIAILVFVFMLGAALIGIISADAIRDDIQQQDSKLRDSVSVMRSLQSKLRQMAAQCDGQEATAVQKLAEELRYSDPVSGPALAEIEADLGAAVDELQQAVVDGDTAGIHQLCRKAMALLGERNRLCKLNKGC